jgi:hypothetical protein
MKSDADPAELRLAADTSGQRWHVPQAFDLAWRCWGGEFVVHHGLSNDTHRISELAGRILTLLQREGPLGLDEVACRCHVDPDQIGSALDALARLDLIAKC